MIRNFHWNTGKSWGDLSFGIDFHIVRISKILKFSLFPHSAGSEQEIEKIKYMEIWK